MYKILLLAAAVAFCSAVPQCPANEQFQECGTACPVTCGNRHDGPRPCILICKQGCFCKQDFFRNTKGVCVREEECDGHAHLPLKPTQKCGANEEFTSCGTACPVTCANRNNLPKFCTLQCVIGCQCQKGFMKNAAGKCVKASQCDAPVAKRQPAKTCGENEELVGCASTCPRTCANRNQGPIACNRMCKLNSCECLKGFVRNGAGRCVKEEQCEETCTGKNEVLTGCMARCQPMCGVNGPRACPAICAPGCTCQDGYARVKSGQCVKREDCPRAVLADAKRSAPGPNEVYSPCSAHCTPTCSNKMPICNRMCVPGYTCAKGFFRNTQGRCVTAAEC